MRRLRAGVQHVEPSVVRSNTHFESFYRPLSRDVPERFAMRTHGLVWDTTKPLVERTTSAPHRGRTAREHRIHAQREEEYHHHDLAPCQHAWYQSPFGLHNLFLEENKGVVPQD